MLSRVPSVEVLSFFSTYQHKVGPSACVDSTHFTAAVAAQHCLQAVGYVRAHYLSQCLLILFVYYID